MDGTRFVGYEREDSAECEEVKIEKTQIIENEDILCSYNMSRAIGNLDQAEALSLQLTYTMLERSLNKRLGKFGAVGLYNSMGAAVHLWVVLCPVHDLPIT